MQDYSCPRGSICAKCTPLKEGEQFNPNPQPNFRSPGGPQGGDFGQGDNFPRGPGGQFPQGQGGFPQQGGQGFPSGSGGQGGNFPSGPQ